MKKYIIIGATLFPLISFASEYVSIISKTNSMYISDSFKIPLDYSIQAWRDVSHKDLSSFMPMAADASSSRQAAYKINVGQENFKGDPVGFKPYDSNYDINKLNHCVSENNGFCSAGNLRQVNYNYKNNSGQYYFEIEVLGQGHTDCVGLSDTTNINAPRASRIGVCYVGNYIGGFKWDQNNQYIDYKIGGGQPSGTVYQIWIDYDKEIMAVMELGSTLIDYKNYNTVLNN